MTIATSLVVVACALRRDAPCSAISKSRSRAEIVGLTQRVLRSVVSDGQVADVCATEAAIDATVRLGIEENIVLLRQIASTKCDPCDSSCDRELDEVVGDALHALDSLGDRGLAAMARKRLDCPLTIANSALIILHFRKDWASTSAVARRLVADKDLRRDFSLAWLGLEFLCDSAEIPDDRCEVIERTSVFATVPAAELGDPTIVRIRELRRQLALRYHCAE